MHIYIYIYTYTCVYIYISIDIQIQAYIIYLYIYIHIYIYTYIYIYMHSWAHEWLRKNVTNERGFPSVSRPFRLTANALLVQKLALIKGGEVQRGFAVTGPHVVERQVSGRQFWQEFRGTQSYMCIIYIYYTYICIMHLHQRCLKRTFAGDVGPCSSGFWLVWADSR